MAIEKPIDTSTGFVVQYHRVAALSIDMDGPYATVLLASYKDREARCAGRSAFPTDVPVKISIPPERLELLGEDFRRALDVVLAGLYTALSQDDALKDGRKA